MSERSSTGSRRSCSGAMYAGVPMSWSARVMYASGPLSTRAWAPDDAGPREGPDPGADGTPEAGVVEEGPDGSGDGVEDGGSEGREDGGMPSRDDGPMLPSSTPAS